jgi:hypothetical protein
MKLIYVISYLLIIRCLKRLTPFSERAQRTLLRGTNENVHNRLSRIDAVACWYE